MSELKLIMTQGLPGSGKSYWARQQKNFAVVEKDQIRLELAKKGWTWSPEREKADVIPERDRQIEECLAQGVSVISSDTNLQREHKVQLSKLARRYNAHFETVRFDVPLEVCLERNQARETGRVPDNVIKTMYNQYIANNPDVWPVSSQSQYKPTPVSPDETLMDAIICDLDGTLALNNGHRGHYEYDTCDQDDLNWPIWKIVRTFHDAHQWQIIYLSGREELGRESTEKFLKKFDCPPGPLFMRTSGDHRKDRIVKLELFDANVRGKYNVRFVLDDRNQVVSMWRELGLTCLQVADGNF